MICLAVLGSVCTSCRVGLICTSPEWSHSALQRERQRYLFTRECRERAGETGKEAPFSPVGGADPSRSDLCTLRDISRNGPLAHPYHQQWTRHLHGTLLLSTPTPMMRHSPPGPFTSIYLTASTWVQCGNSCVYLLLIYHISSYCGDLYSSASVFESVTVMILLLHWKCTLW
jgi:hypothetical protein